MPILVHAVRRPELPPFVMPDRFRTDVAYFMTPGGSGGVPPLAANEYFVDRETAKRLLDDGFFEIISPLDTNRPAEIELTEAQEDWLRWMVEQDVQHIRLEDQRRGS